MSKNLKIAISAAVSLALVAVVGLWLFFGGDSPDEVSLDAATEQVLGSESIESGVSETGQGELSDIDGAWQLDAETGEFDYESASGSFVGFRIEEELSGVGSVTAVGRTGDVTGSLAIETTSLTAATFDVDMTTITTDDSRRDDNVQDALEIADYPSASFVLTQAIELGDGAGSGESVSVTAEGELTIHGVTKSVSIPIEAQLKADTVVVVGSVNITFADYDVEVPESRIVVSVEDSGILEFQLLFTR